MDTVTLKINGKTVSVPKGSTILEAAKIAGFEIPTLCYLKGICSDTNCRVCVVEVKGARTLVTACGTQAAEGMEVLTNTPKVKASRKMTVELILSNHDKRCLSCVRSQNCELQKLSLDLDCDAGHFQGVQNMFPVEDSNPFIVRDNSKCVLCRRCVNTCHQIQSVGAIGANSRGFTTYVGCAFDKKLENVPCVACGQCVAVCPVGALREKSSEERVSGFIADPDLFVIAGTAPAVRVALGEEFGMSVGNNVEGKMVSALKMLGFNNVFDVDLTADLTIMEEGTEFIGRLQTPGAVLPMITSCSPAWIRFMELYYPDQLGHLSTCKSPQQMFGAVMKTYYAQKMGIDPAKIRVVSVMPCIAKKYEMTRADQSASGYPDIDAVITTRELARMIKSAGIDFNALKNGKFDNPLGKASSAGLIFGATGGVMEAALRTVAEVVLGNPLENLDFHAVRGVTGIKETTVTLGDIKVNICVASGLANARKIMDEVKAGTSPYHFIEIMSCPGGCVKGGGQPQRPASLQNQIDLRLARAKAIYKSDKAAKLRKSHENPVIKTLYQDYFGAPGSHKAHKALHTSYSKKDKF
ncbi:MAG: NADH-dependent [FeFe] hydrogenase, group A6 [Firmicutes bacterium]|nr:NADH-dependent [FeFe] hydrogenase, group A6 [Bacillota bacterium]